jgi:hypothetical protein
MLIDKWIFKHKFKADGSLDWYRAHWVLRRLIQRLGVDYNETFRPMAKPTTMLTLALSRGWPVHQLNVKNVFLHDTLTETVYYS